MVVDSDCVCLSKLVIVVDSDCVCLFKLNLQSFSIVRYIGYVRKQYHSKQDSSFDPHMVQQHMYVTGLCRGLSGIYTVYHLRSDV